MFSSGENPLLQILLQSHLNQTHRQLLEPSQDIKLAKQIRDGDYATCIFNESYKGGTGKQHPAAKVETLTEKKPKKSTSQLKAKSDPVDLSVSGEEDESWPFLSYLSSHTQSPNAKTFNQ